MYSTKLLIATFAFSVTTVALSNDGAAPAAKAAEATQPAATESKESQEAKAAAPSAVGEYSCTMDKAKRTVRVTYEKEGAKVPCKVNYVRDTSTGEEKVLYSAAAQEGYCEQKAGEFVEKLKSTGWSCSNP